MKPQNFRFRIKQQALLRGRKAAVQLGRDGIGNEAVIWNKQSRKIICNEVKA